MHSLDFLIIIIYLIMTTLIEQYNEELKQDTKIDEVNVKQVAMALPAIKHKWVSRLIVAKQELMKLEKIKTQAIEAVSKKIHEQSSVAISDIAANRAAESYETCQKINDSIAEHKILIEYLEKIERLFNSTTYDVGNIVKIMQMEQT